MNLQSAERQIEKLLNYVQEIKSENPTFYKKSKQRLSNIAATCNQIIYLISDILESEIMNSGDCEFGCIDDSVLNSVLSMESSLSCLKRFISNTSNIKHSSNSKVVNDYLELFDDKVDRYVNLSDTSNVKQAVCLINRWLHVRFVEYGDGFSYGEKFVSQWLRDIVIMFAYHNSIGSADMFMSKFLQWCDGVDGSSAYSVPYEIFSLSKNNSLYKKYLTVDALLLWDALIEYGMGDVCTLNTDDGFVSEDDVFRLCEVYRPELIETYETSRNTRLREVCDD